MKSLVKGALYSTLILVTSCRSEDSANCGYPCTYQEELVFQTSFNNTTLVDAAWSKVDFFGTDTAFSSNSSWEGLNNHPNIGSIRISYEEGNNSQRIAQIVEDPDQPGNNVISFRILEPHIQEGSKRKGRVQFNLNGNNCIREYYQKVKLKLHPDMAHLLNYSERISWLSVFEFWNNADWTHEKFPFRVTVNLTKPYKGSGSEMYFHAKADYKTNAYTSPWILLWAEEQLNYPVPFGIWMDIEVYIKEGDQNNGRFYMAITPEGQGSRVLFDIYDITQHPEETCPDGFTQLNPLKLYTSDKLINYMKNNNKRLEVYWDDWTFYRNKQP